MVEQAASSQARHLFDSRDFFQRRLTDRRRHSGADDRFVCDSAFVRSKAIYLSPERADGDTEIGLESICQNDSFQ